MAEFTYEYNLYALYDRAFEDCMVDVTVSVPDNWMDICPQEEEIKLVKVAIQEATKDYLEGTMRTDITKLEADIVKDLPSHLYTDAIEHLSDELELNSPEDLNKWFND